MALKSIGSLPYSLSLRLTTPGDKTSEKKIYGQIQQRETVGLRTLATHIREHGSSYSVGTLQGVLSDMVDCTRELLKQGYSVNFEGLMRLYVTANSQGVSKAEDFNPSAHFTRINLRVDVDDDVQDFLNNNPDYEYSMTREEQAAAKKAAKAALVVEGTGTEGAEEENGGNSTVTPDPNSGENTGGENTGGNTGGDNGGGGGTTPPGGNTGNDD